MISIGDITFTMRSPPEIVSRVRLSNFLMRDEGSDQKFHHCQLQEDNGRTTSEDTALILGVDRGDFALIRKYPMCIARKASQALFRV